MSASTGQSLDSTDHLVQSIADILGTPLGSRVMRRDYGSLLFSLIDQPLTAATAMLLRAATAVALRRWEPRLTIQRVTLGGDASAGQASITISGTRTDQIGTGARTTLTIPLPRTIAS
ncbi:MAG: GPW/gp25 family protein [Sphingobium sp.]